ncbi:uncharacterized protein [Palaemon carinicauda]|uniref:uncharacterized protein n=1 Tax=Palaemon carinicauda TaxID=392227 RepID=UPI0035B66803
MFCDDCPMKSTSSSSHCILDLGIKKKAFKKNPSTNTVMIFYIALLHVCLFVSCEASGENEAVKPHTRLYISDPKLDAGPSLVDLVRERRSSSTIVNPKLVKRLASEERVSAVDNSPSSSSSNASDDDKSVVNSKSVVQESKDLDSEVVDDPTSGPVVNTTPKARVSNESSDTGQTVENTEEDELGLGPPSGLKPDAILRLFYVFVFVGVIVLIYILIKFLRFRRKRATRKYRVLSHTDEQEMFPLAADDGDDEEIFNAADHQTLK